MKIGTLEGSPQEIKDLVDNHGLRIEDYLETPTGALAKRWLLAPAGVVALSLILMAVIPGLSHQALILLFVLGLAGGTWLTVAVEIRFRNTVATSAVAIGVLLALLVAAGLIAPRETIDELRKLHQPGS
jgi:hypothetical protein